MHTSALVALVLAAGSEVVLASISNTVVNGNNNSGVSSSATTKLKGSPRRRDIEALFRRDPEYEEIMHELARRAGAKDVDGMVADIKKGTTPQPLVKAANIRGLTKNVQGFQGANAGNAKERPQLPKSQQPKQKREAEPNPTKPAAAAGGKSGAASGKPGVISGPKGQVHPPAKVAQHVETPGSYIPDKIKGALQESKNFLAPGQYSSNPTAKPLAKRSIDGEVLHVRSDGAVSQDEFNVLINSMKRDPAAKKDIMQTLKATPEVKQMTSNLISKYVPDSDGEVNYRNMRSLVDTMQSDYKAQRGVLAAFNKNEMIAKATLGLFDKWAAPEDVVKRDEDEEFAYLAARDLDNEMQYLGLSPRDLHDDEAVFETRDLLGEEYSHFEARDPEAEAQYELFDLDFDF